MYTNLTLYCARITSSDYTVAVNNPPKDAFNADEWRNFFSQFTSNQVTAVTIALNNRKLLEKLIQRRRHLNNLRVILPKGTDMDDENALQIAVAELVREREQEKVDCFMYILQVTLILPIIRVALGWFLTPATLLEKSLRLTKEIKELQTEKYDVVKVFVTFEDEEGQRAALSSLSVTRLDIINNMTHRVGTVFNGQVLSVSETAEPNAIRWLDLQASPVKMNVMRLVNLGITTGVVTIAGVVVARVRQELGASFAGPLITILNTVVPIGLKILMIFEPHHTEGSFQSSLYMKITLFRWVNTAILIKMITSWTSTLGYSPSNL
jgi:Cytosolic domain of 10TM putative phosphate transporter